MLLLDFIKTQVVRSHESQARKDYMQFVRPNILLHSPDGVFENFKEDFVQISFFVYFSTPNLEASSSAYRDGV